SSVQGLVPAMALQTAALQLHATVEPAYSNTTGHLDGARLRREGQPSILVPMLSDEPYTLIDQVGTPSAFQNLSMSDVADGTFDPAMVKGKAVVFGVNLIGSGEDQRVTPFSEKYPGTYLHASMISNILGDAFLHRPAEARLVEGALMLLFALVL